MTRGEIEAIAQALPATSKVIQWGASDVHKVGGKVFAICGLAGGLSFKVSPIGFEVLTSDGPARQAPYLAKGHWVIVELDDLDPDDAQGWIATAHSLISAKLTKTVRAELGL